MKRKAPSSGASFFPLLALFLGTVSMKKKAELSVYLFSIQVKISWQRSHLYSIENEYQQRRKKPRWQETR